MGGHRHSHSPCFGVIVVSDRIAEGLESDISGEETIKELKKRGLCVGRKLVVKNSYRDILKAIRESEDRVLILIGGTGPSPRDITVDVIEGISWRCLPGFGELFRHISYQRAGPYAALSRTTLCILHNGRIVVALPGSTDAVLLGVNILLQIIDHIIEEVDRFEAPHRG